MSNDTNKQILLEAIEAYANAIRADEWPMGQYLDRIQSAREKLDHEIDGMFPLAPPAASGQQEVPQKQALLDALQEYLNARDDDVGPFFVAGAKQRTREAGEELYNLIDAIFAHPAPAQQERAWRPLNDVQWMNIVNHDHVYESFSKEDAVHEAVKRTEAKLRENNEGRAPAPAALTEADTLRLKLMNAIMDIPSAAPAEQAMPWLPIDSAPNGGCLIDILMPNGKRWCGVHYDRICNEWRLITECGKLLRVKRDYPTHWMPLPPAPDAAIASQQKGGAV